jgi:hypothetical protein
MIAVHNGTSTIAASTAITVSLMPNQSSFFTRQALGLYLGWALFAGTPAMSHANELEARNVDAVRSAFSSWSAGTGNPFDLLAPEATWTIVGRSVVAKTYPDKEAFIREVITPFNARMQSPLVPTVRDVLADGDMVVVVFDARTMARDGQPYANTYAWFLKMRADKIVSVTAFFDSIAFNEFRRRHVSVTVPCRSPCPERLLAERLLGDH